MSLYLIIINYNECFHCIYIFKILNACIKILQQGYSKNDITNERHF